MGVMGMMLAGDQMWRWMSLPPPALYLQMKENRFMVIMASMFIGNIISQSLSSTKAFEVYFNGRTVWSAIEMGGVPKIEYLLDQLAKAGANERSW